MVSSLKDWKSARAFLALWVWRADRMKNIMEKTAAPGHSEAALANKGKILNRLRRLEGQVRGLQKMVEEERDCREILALSVSIKSALDATSDLILECYLEDCQRAMAKGGANPKSIVEAVKLARR